MKNLVWIASDHAGYQLKSQLILLCSNLVSWNDLGPHDEASVDYPDYADRLALRVTESRALGVLICGSGQGMAIRANRYPQVRAALCWSEEITSLARAHNNANVLCLPGRMMSPDQAANLFEIFLNTPFEAGRHQKRVDKLGGPLCT